MPAHASTSCHSRDASEMCYFSPMVVNIWPCHSGELLPGGSTSRQSSVCAGASMWFSHGRCPCCPSAGPRRCSCCCGCWRCACSSDWRGDCAWRMLPGVGGGLSAERICTCCGQQMTPLNCQSQAGANSSPRKESSVGTGIHRQDGLHMGCIDARSLLL